MHLGDRQTDTSLLFIVLTFLPFSNRMDLSLTSFVLLQILLSALFPMLASAISSNCFYLPHIALNGGTYDEFNAPEIKHCCIACARDPCCIAYTYEKERGRCFMKSAISDSYKHSGMTSGLKANTHAGQGALLRNIRISGGTASAVVNLPNTEDCLQYCTAYGIFSWSPLPPSATTTTTPSGNPNNDLLSSPPSSNSVTASINNMQVRLQGECSCMSRISSLEYSFGSRSAIFPPVSNL